MAYEEDVSDAREVLRQSLNISTEAANRIFALLQERYRTQIANTTRSSLIEAATWAADRLKGEWSGDMLERHDPEILVASLSGGCPLCA